MAKDLSLIRKAAHYEGDQRYNNIVILTNSVRIFLNGIVFRFSRERSVFPNITLHHFYTLS